MSSFRPAPLARRLFVSVRREGPSAELHARILAAGRAEIERARGVSASAALRAPERSAHEARQPVSAKERPGPARGARRWVALGALAAAAAVLGYLGAGPAPEHGVMISAERTGLPAPVAPAPAVRVPTVPASDEAAPGPSPPPATRRDDGVAPSNAKRPTPASARPAEPKLEPTKRETGTQQPAPAPRASLGEQLEQLKSARAALRAGDHRRALELIDAYRAQPTGELAAEASLLRIEALAMSGQREAAARAARQFASDYPTSPLIDRALSYAAAGDGR